MATMIDRDVERFLSAIAETPHLWRSVDVKVVALHVAGDWHNLFAQFQLRSVPPEEVIRPTDFPRLPYFTVFQDVFPPEDVPNLIAAVRTGLLEVQGHTVRFLSGESNNKPFGESYSRSWDHIGS
ncbi:MAG TPA: hypothetical protein VFX98_15905, partial [Longimicrobiaceae bacterium]|nr:hypothetical protein [Longimicrobiaceae bacterium]